MSGSHKVEGYDPATGESFTLTLKEVTLPTPGGGTVTRPCSAIVVRGRT